MKKARILLLCLIMLLGGSVCMAEALPPEIAIAEPQPPFPTPPSLFSLPKATSAAKEADFSISYSGDITGYAGTDSIIEIPSSVGGIQVTGIASGAFANNERLTHVTLPKGVVRIGSSAFSKCVNLETITLPEGLKTIEGWAFDQCTSLKSISIPSGVESLGYCAFYTCTSLNAVSLPGSLVTIEGWVFGKCTSLRELTVPKNVASIGECVFYQCDSLEKLTLSDKIVCLGDYFAAYCINLKSVNIPASAVSIGQYAFFGCELITSIKLPDALVSIDDYAFYKCSALSGTLKFPKALKAIGENAFARCAQIERAELPDGIETLKEGSLPPDAVLVFGSSSLIEEYAVSHGMQFICDNRDTTNDSSIDTVEEKIDWILANYITPGMSEYEKALRLYNWLCANVAYDYQWLDTNVPTTEYGVTEEGALLGGWAVCEGYARAYVHLLQEAGMESAYVHGLAGGGSHAWVFGKIDGDWYLFDPTWDEAGNGSAHIYFGLTNYAMGFNHTPLVNKHIICDSYEYNYEYRTGKYDALLSMLTEAIDTDIEQGVYSDTIDVSAIDKPSHFWGSPSPYTVAFILSRQTDWSVPGRVEVVPADPGFRFQFYPGGSVVSDLQVFGLEKPDYVNYYHLAPSESIRLTVVTEPANVPVTFSSSNTSVLRVDSTGLLTGVSEGFSTLTVSVGSYSVEYGIVVDTRSVLFEQDPYIGSVGGRLTVRPFITNDEAGSYQNDSKYIGIQIIGGDAVEYVGYYNPEWNSSLRCWSYPFAADCIEPGAVTLVAILIDDSEIAETCRVVIHDTDPLELPSSVREIHAEAFMGLTIEEIVLTEGIVRIGERAFADCAELELINLPSSLKSIAPDAFDGCTEVTLLCAENSYAHSYAQSEGLDYVLID